MTINDQIALALGQALMRAIVAEAQRDALKAELAKLTAPEKPAPVTLS
jgi:hypothetical protein